MEHIFNIAIDFDDERIRHGIEEAARKSIIDKIRRDVEGALYSHSYYDTDMSETHRIGITPYLSEQIGKFLEANRDAIIKSTSKELADKIARSKRGKEILDNLVKDDDG